MTGQVELFDAGRTIVAPPNAGTYKTVLADPPWHEQGGGKIKRGADRHYPLMSTEAICALPVKDWAAPDAHCYLWVTNNFFEDGFEVLRAWNFRYITTISWFKGSIDDAAADVLVASETGSDRLDADLQIGIGQYFRGSTEHVLFGVRGMVPYKTRPDGKRAQGRTGFHAPRGEHSAKPEKFRRMVEDVSTGPYLELFARRPVPGWTLWGNQAPESDAQERE